MMTADVDTRRVSTNHNDPEIYDKQGIPPVLNFRPGRGPSSTSTAPLNASHQENQDMQIDKEQTRK
jgi:hypothetical protein